MVSKEEDKMKITTDRLKEIIKEEIEVTLTNEEAAEMFGDEALEKLDEDLSNLTPENMQMAIRALIQMAENFAPLVGVGAGALLKQVYDGWQQENRGRTPDEEFEDEEDPWAHPVPEM